MRRVVVTGMGAVTPIGNDLPSFWSALTEGKCGVGPITRFDASEYKSTLAAEVKEFDPLLYMDKGEARKNDLFSQFAIASAQQAVAQSGIEGNIAPERLGVYYGSGIGGIMTVSSELEKLLSKGPRKVSPFFIPMFISNMGAGNIAIRFNAKGPCLSIATACASGTSAIGEALSLIHI